MDGHKKEENAGIETSTESFAVSLNNEFNHYKKAILSLVEASQSLEMKIQLEALEACFKDLLTSIPHNKYKEAINQCTKRFEGLNDCGGLESENQCWPGDIIAEIKYQNGALDEAKVQSLLSKNDDYLLSVENDKERGEFIRNRLLLELSKKLESLLIEINDCNRKANTYFDFNLEKEDYFSEL